MSECSQLTAYNYSNPTVYIVRCTVQYSTVQYSTVQYSTVQYSIIQNSTIQYNTVQYSTLRYSTVDFSNLSNYGHHCSSRNIACVGARDGFQILDIPIASLQICIDCDSKNRGKYVEIKIFFMLELQISIVQLRFLRTEFRYSYFAANRIHVVIRRTIHYL